MRILVSNDDGIHAEGLRALSEAMQGLGEVWVVAPEFEQSAASHAISLHRPLRIKELGGRRFSVDGTPTDCSYIAINHLMKDERPALMVSGVNHGANLADDVTYSGTVAAAMEASLLGVPAIAFSLVAHEPFDFGPAARFARKLAETVLANPPTGRMLLNVNVPGGADPDSYTVTQLGKHSYGYDVVENVDPRGRKYYWIGGSSFTHEDIPGSDCNAVFREGRISITPLHLDLTEYDQMELVRSWKVDGYRRE
ncbi:MAG: 5'/3'-nucleotidase SurE [Myxococcaceae bacterium]|nr:5'/3'-nucleotidase SurE [Myxococcaceae bacterium]